MKITLRFMENLGLSLGFNSNFHLVLNPYINLAIILGSELKTKKASLNLGASPAAAQTRLRGSSIINGFRRFRHWAGFAKNKARVNSRLLS